MDIVKHDQKIKLKSLNETIKTFIFLLLLVLFRNIYFVSFNHWRNMSSLTRIRYTFITEVCSQKHKVTHIARNIRFGFNQRSKHTENYP